MSSKTVQVQGFAQAGNQFVVSTRGLDIRISKNPNQAALEGPSPIEYVLAGFAGCIHAVSSLVARERQIELSALEVDISASLDTDKYYGRPTTARAGFESIQITVKPTSTASAQTLASWLEEVESRCPVQDNLLHPTPVALTLVAEAGVAV